MRTRVVVLVLALAACHGGRSRPVPTPTVVGPAQSGIYVTTSGPRGAEVGIHNRVPALHGLPAAVAALANRELLLAVDHEAFPVAVEGQNLVAEFVDGELGAVDDRYVTVDLVVTLRYEPGGTFYDVRPVVIERATGRRLLFDDLLAPGAVPVVAAYATERLPVVLDRAVGHVPAERAVLDRLTPLPEGMQVALPGRYAGVPHGDPVFVVVPWARLAPYRRATPPLGDRDPGYRDGRRPRDYELAVLARAYPKPVTRWQVSQIDLAWALAQSGRDRIALRGESGGWRVYEEGPSGGCATMPAAVRASFALRCP